MTPDEIERAHPLLQPHLRQLAAFQYVVDWYAQRTEQIAQEHRRRRAALGLSLPERPPPPIRDM